MHIRLISIALLMYGTVLTSGLADVIINEVGSDEIGDISSQWIELYNNGDTDVDISSWSIVPLSNRSEEVFIDIANISAKGFYVIDFEYEFMDPSGDVLILKDELEKIVDRTPLLYEVPDSSCSWGRFPDGSNVWLRLRPTRGKPSRELCGDEETGTINYQMDKIVEGSGYVNIRNVVRGDDESYIKSRESGSGTYRSEEASKFYKNLKGKAYAIDLSKSNLSLRYSNTSFAVTPDRSVSHDEKWLESSSAQGDQDSPNFCESNTHVSRLDSDISISYKNYDLGARLESELEGVSRINANLIDFKSYEEYAGSFKLLNDYKENISNEIRLSVEGEGFISTEKKIGKEDADSKAHTYEKGTGIYRSEELIGASDISALNISRFPVPERTKIFLAKDTSLLHAPVNYPYSGIMPEPMSIAWREGTGSENEQGPFMSSEFSDISQLETETLLTSSEMRTSAQFTGRGRLKAGYRDPLNGSVFREDEYVGEFSIDRRYEVYPKFKVPHMSIRSQGRIDPQDCSKLKYIITVVNDGNRPLGPIFVRTSFPSGTSFLDASVRPFELTSRYANWSISDLSVGEASNMNLDLQITRRNENYSSSSRAITIYQVTRRNITTDRRLRASNTSRLAVNWSDCDMQDLSVAFVATPNSKNPKILNYRLTVENLAEENISANITATLPPEIRFINSTTRGHEQLSEDMIRWTIKKLDAGKRRSISFMAEAKDEGFYVANATVAALSLDDGVVTSVDVTASVMVGKKVYAIKSGDWQDWLPCDENLLGKSWDETSAVSGKDLGCVC